MKSPSQLGVALFRWLAATAIIAGLMFALAGRRDLPTLWAYVAVFSALQAVKAFTVPAASLSERLGRGEDRMGSVLIGLLFAATMLVAVLDVGRFHWSDTVPWVLRTSALVLFALSMGLTVWAMGVNPYSASLDVRIEAERGHRVVSGGPYGWVRHPGHAGLLVAAFATAVSLGSWWALLPAAAYAAMIFRRTALEDRFLTEKLEGYATYAGTVRYRLAPGLW